MRSGNAAEISVESRPRKPGVSRNDMRPFSTTSFWLLFAAFLIVTPGCGVQRFLVRTPDPVNAQCDAACYLPCDAPLDLTDGSANTLKAVADVNRAFLARCTVRHDACRTCIQGLKQAKVIQ
jgi:hypothetical protein